MELEALCIQLGIQQYIPALSELRDKLLRSTAAQLQESAISLASKTAELEAAQTQITSLQAQLDARQETSDNPDA